MTLEHDIETSKFSFYKKNGKFISKINYFLCGEMPVGGNSAFLSIFRDSFVKKDPIFNHTVSIYQRSVFFGLRFRICSYINRQWVPGNSFLRYFSFLSSNNYYVVIKENEI